MKNVLLIGLGRFGRHMAQKLHDLNHQVLAIDKDERRVQDAMAYVTNAEIGDAADPALIDALGVEEFDLCVVTMGHDLQASLEITLTLEKARRSLRAGARGAGRPRPVPTCLRRGRGDLSGKAAGNLGRRALQQQSHLRLPPSLAGIRHL